MQQNSLGMIELKSIAAAIEAANIITKTSEVEIIGKKIAGEGTITLFFQGNLGVLESTVENLVITLQKRREYLVKNIIPAAHEETINLFFKKNNSLSSHISNVGVLETKGMVGLFSAADAMVKNTNVRILGMENLPGVLAALKIEGEIEHLKAALGIGAEIARKFGQFIRASIIPELDSKTAVIFNNLSESYSTANDENNSPKILKPKLKKPKQIKEVNKASKNSKPENTDKHKTNEDKKKAATNSEYTEQTLFDAMEINDTEPEINNLVTDENYEDLDNPEEETREDYSIGETSDLKIEGLEKLSVSKLRKLARDFDSFPIKGRNISMANRNTLLEYFKRMII